MSRTYLGRIVAPVQGNDIVKVTLLAALKECLSRAAGEFLAAIRGAL
jgi:hypothetical protein